MAKDQSSSEVQSAEHGQGPESSRGNRDPARWVEDHGDAMFRFAMMHLRDRQVAEDLVQETFLAALRGLKRYQERASMRTWLISILRHKLIDHLRRRRNVSLVDVDSATQPVQPRSDALQFWESDPADLYERREFWETFETCTEKLPELLKDVYFLREIAELTSAEICEQIQIKPNNLAVRLHRARVLLRECLEKKWFLASE